MKRLRIFLTKLEFNMSYPKWAVGDRLYKRQLDVLKHRVRKIIKK